MRSESASRPEPAIDWEARTTGWRPPPWLLLVGVSAIGCVFVLAPEATIRHPAFGVAVWVWFPFLFVILGIEGWRFASNRSLVWRACEGEIQEVAGVLWPRVRRRVSSELANVGFFVGLMEEDRQALARAAAGGPPPAEVRYSCPRSKLLGMALLLLVVPGMVSAWSATLEANQAEFLAQWALWSKLEGKIKPRLRAEAIARVRARGGSPAEISRVHVSTSHSGGERGTLYGGYHWERRRGFRLVWSPSSQDHGDELVVFASQRRAGWIPRGQPRLRLEVWGEEAWVPYLREVLGEELERAGIPYDFVSGDQGPPH